MKTLLSLIMIGAFFVIVPSALADRPKPPSRQCLEWESNANYHHLSIDSSGKIYDKDNMIVTYIITGVDQNGVITGSGYVARGTRTLIATYSGMHSGNALSTYQLQYNLTTKTGTINYRYDVPPASEPVTGSDVVYNIGCKSLDIPPPE